MGPNFFLIGAPKCGTTSVAAWLSQHPQVFTSSVKELDYFNRDIRKSFDESEAQYFAHFAAATAQHVAIGEASTGYLRSAVAVRDIELRLPGSRYIVCLRNPVDMALAWYRQMLYECWEDARDFEQAWALQAERSQGRLLPARCPEPDNLQYARVCALGTQVERVMSLVGTARLHFVLLDDLRDRPREVWCALQEFLGVPDDSRQHFPVMNAASDVPSALARAIRIVSDFKRRTGIGFGFGILNVLRQRLAKPHRDMMAPATRAMLREHFLPEIEKLQRCTGRDLSNWH